MRTYKRFIGVLAIGVMFGATISSCNKYEEGGNFSLRSAQKRVLGHYGVSEMDIKDVHGVTFEPDSFFWANSLNKILLNIDDYGASADQLQNQFKFEKDGQLNMWVALVDFKFGLAYQFAIVEVVGSWELFDDGQQIYLTFNKPYFQDTDPQPNGPVRQWTGEFLRLKKQEMKLELLNSSMGRFNVISLEHNNDCVEC